MSTTPSPTGPGTGPPSPEPWAENVDPAAVRARIHELHRRHAGLPVEQIVSFYPPEAESWTDLFGLSGVHVSGVRVSVGDCEQRFPLHSISKVFTYALALEDNGREATLDHVGVEPSGDPYNSISFDEERNRPHNPMVNAGALVATSLIRGRTPEEKVGRLLERLRLFSGNTELHVDAETLDQQLKVNDRNLATSYLMRSLGMLHGNIEDNILVYLSVCSVMVTTDELAVMGATLANGGTNPLTGNPAMPSEHARDVTSVMTTCGMYDAAGQWFYDVGIPAKSGVSGGIVAAIPERIGIAVYSPGLDAHGNSVRGVNICRDLSTNFGLHVFAAPRRRVFT
ncbi:glutaminase A [Actinomycetospora endophytica]|uniref:Glutaminase n=1 Tax=Actinomycetospora endophytica TaxID=2291215 RepID=A0ABS8P0Q3_9PSEU|nr:glutaminase A [Actinomycetospora endophytica]MCD2191823.1 glutaminase A [Actinomycetospora endophytica]